MQLENPPGSVGVRPGAWSPVANVSTEVVVGGWLLIGLLHKFRSLRVASPCADDSSLSWRSLRRARYGQRLGVQATEVHVGAGVMNLDAHDPPLSIQIDDHVRCDLAGIHSGSIGEIDVEGVRIRVIMKSHCPVSEKPRSRKAVRTVSPSARVTTRRYLPSSAT